MRDSLIVEILEAHQETPNVTTLVFRRPFTFTPGQYLTVFAPGSQVAEGKAYSIASLPNDEKMKICVKNVGGEFSQYLCSRQAGDSLEISARAYGFFNPQTDKPLVGITGGCGLSPIWSVLASCLPKQPTSLFYAVKRPIDVVFRQALQDSLIHCNFYSTTKKVAEKDGWHNGRFAVGDIVRSSPDSAHFLLCGSVEFVREVRAQLVAAGIGDERISSEVFFEQ